MRFSPGREAVRGSDLTNVSTRRGFRRLFYLIFVALIVGVAIVYWSWVDAQTRAVVVISSVLEAPVITPTVEAMSGKPHSEDISVSGNPALLMKPEGHGPWPAIFLVNGTVPEGRKYPGVRHLAEGMARAGYLVVVPDLPGLTEDTITPRTVQETTQVARKVSTRSDAEGGKVALVGVSTGATLGLVAAEKPELRGRVSVVAGVAPYADIRTVLSVATTSHYRRDDGELVRYKAAPFLSYVVARSLIAALPPGEDRQMLQSELEKVDREDPHPLAGLRSRPTNDLGPEARSVVELLANENPRRYNRLYSTLPTEVRKDLEKFSPLATKRRVHVPVEVATGPHDKYFPPYESYELKRVAPKRRVTVTGALDHTELNLSLADVPAFAALDAFVVRSLREALLDH
jgi:pimeloyl-ACP methyl ester carboxylesterase